MPGLANRLGARLHAVRRRRRFPDTALPHAPRTSGCRSGATIATLDRAALRAEARGALRARPRPPDAAGHRRLAGRRSGSTTAVRGAAAALRGGRRPGAARRRPGKRGRRRRRRPATPPYVVRAVRRPDGPRLRRRRPRAVPGRREHRHRADRASACRVFVPLPIGNGEQRLNARPRRRRRRRAAGRRRRAAPRTGCAGTLLPLLHRRRPAGRDGRGRRRPRSPRDADERLADMVLRPRRAEAAR